MTDRWALYVDVEGFGSKWNETTMDAFRGINTLMECIFRVGTEAYPDTPKRLFAHQFGDAFLIASDFHEATLDRAVLVGVALLRQMLAVGETAKCALDEGEVSDIVNCYPDSIRTQYHQGHISIGAGIMTITPIMGTALIRTASLHKKVRGPLFVMRKELSHRISTAFASTEIPESRLVSLNWLRGDLPELQALQATTGLSQTTESQRIARLQQYIADSPELSVAWRDNAEKHLLNHVA